MAAFCGQSDECGLIPRKSLCDNFGSMNLSPFLYLCFFVSACPSSLLLASRQPTVSLFSLKFISAWRVCVFLCLFCSGSVSRRMT